MLLLKRVEGEKVLLTTGAGERIEIKIVKHTDGRVILGFEAPASVRIEREEIIPEHLKGT